MMNKDNTIACKNFEILLKDLNDIFENKMVAADKLLELRIMFSKLLAIFIDSTKNLIELEKDVAELKQQLKLGN